MNHVDARVLEIENLHVFYGGIHALKGINLAVAQGKIVALIGASGAGKSTTLRTISGLVKPQQGVIRFLGEDITGKAPHQVVARGVVMVPEGRKIFPNLTVMENLILGSYIRTNRQEVKADLDWVFTFFPRLRERIWQRGGTLSGGEQQMLAVARALMSQAPHDGRTVLGSRPTPRAGDFQHYSGTPAERSDYSSH